MEKEEWKKGELGVEGEKDRKREGRKGEEKG